jgi:ABC-type glycerol-3-phosphate transport system substrate-binding protein
MKPQPAQGWSGTPLTRRTLLIRGGLLAGGAASAGFLAACGSGGGAGGSSSGGGGGGGGGSITIGAEKGSPYTDFHKSKVAEFEKQTGIKVNWVEVPHDNMHERFLTESIGGGGTIDVFQGDQPWVAEFAAAGYLVPVDGMVDKNDLKDFLPVGLSTLTYQDKLYGLPYIVHNSVLYYRTDLLEKAGVPKPPTTWDEYRALAKELTDPSAGVFGTVVEGKNGIEPGAKFMDILQQAGGGVLDDSGKVIFGTQPTIDAFNHLLAIQYQDKSSPPGGPGFDNGDTGNMFLQGKLATMPNWPYIFGLGADKSQSKVLGKYRVAKQPGKVSQTAEVFSWGYVIASGSKKKDEAFQFVKWAASPEMSEGLGRQFINPVPRLSVISKIKADSSLDEHSREAITVMTESVAGSKTFPSHPKWPDMHNRVSLALNRVMTRQASPEQEAAAAQADIQGIVGS